MILIYLQITVFKKIKNRFLETVSWTIIMNHNLNMAKKY